MGQQDGMGWFNRHADKATARGFLSRLAGDTRANTLAIMAAALLPIAALAGSAVDTARMYVVKVRLQQACDAGALAGRKFVPITNQTAPPTLDPIAIQQGTTFFNNNFRQGWMGTTAVSFTPIKTADSQVHGDAQATVPMTLMKIFGSADVTIKVACEARYDVADADIMFVLDTTGSMACLTSDNKATCDSWAIQHVVKNGDGSYSVTEKPDSRIDGLRAAVLDFYDTVTNPNLADPTTHYRFGFVPFSANVNVGHLLPRSYLVNQWNYQSRVQGADSTLNSPSKPAATTTTKAVCDGYNNIRTPATGYVPASANWTYTIQTSAWTAGTGGNGSCQKSIQTYQANFTYQQVSNLDVTHYANFETVTTPGFPAYASGYTQPTSNWPGCVEERATTVTATPSSSSPPLDLDVDTAPTDDNSRWKPLWLDVEYLRAGKTSETSANAARNPLGRSSGYTDSNALAINDVPCPKTASRLSSMQLGSMDTATVQNLRSTISNYIDETTGFRPFGVTYLDAGMTWGTRLISKDGIFSGDTTAWPAHNPPNRYIIFLTDGTMEPSQTAYASHGIEQLDGRVTGGTMSNLTAYHQARFNAACAIARTKATVFVISYAGAALKPTDDLYKCASAGQAYSAVDAAALKTAFETIAQQVAMLRVSK